MSRREKAIWTGFFALLLFLELRSIHFDQVDHDREQSFARCQDAHNFQHIADTLNASIQESQGQYVSTIGHVDGVLTTAQHVQSLSEQSLADITGGNSYAYVVPPSRPRAIFSVPITLDDRFTVVVRNAGDHLLTNVFVSIAVVKNELGLTDGGLAESTNVGVLAKHGQAILPNIAINPIQDHTTHYFALITAPSGVTAEDIYLRPSKDGSWWAYRLVLKHRTFDQHGVMTETSLPTVEWTEP